MEYRCIKARGGVAIGDVVEVPDGAVVSPLYFEAATPPPAPGDGMPAPPAPVLASPGAAEGS